MSKEEKNRRRTCNLWYSRWLSMAQDLKLNRLDKRGVLLFIFRAIDNSHGFKYGHIACSSFADLRLVFEDCLNKDCENCEKRFECFTEGKHSFG